MGWTGIYVGTDTVNRKVFLDVELWEHCKNQFKLLRSTVVNSTYYAVATHLETGKTSAWVVLTAMDDGEFFYKEMNEDMGPNEAKMPESMVKLLSPTDSEYANNWRRRCMEYSMLEKMYKSKRPLMGEITYKGGGYEKGDTVKLTFRDGLRKRYGAYTDGCYKWSKRLVLGLENLRYQ